MKLKVTTYMCMVMFVMNFVYCQQKAGLTEKLISIEKDSFFCFDSLYTDEEWDSLYILSPYTEIDKINIELDANRKQDIRYALLSDGVYTLIFTNKNKYVFHETIPRKSVDFSLSKINKFDRSSVFYKDTASVVRLRKE